jgi:hypothetical protein
MAQLRSVASCWTLCSCSMKCLRQDSCLLDFEALSWSIYVCVVVKSSCSIEHYYHRVSLFFPLWHIFALKSAFSYINTSTLVFSFVYAWKCYLWEGERWRIVDIHIARRQLTTLKKEGQRSSKGTHGVPSRARSKALSESAERSNWPREEWKEGLAARHSWSPPLKLRTPCLPYHTTCYLHPETPGPPVDLCKQDPGLPLLHGYSMCKPAGSVPWKQHHRTELPEVHAGDQVMSPGGS